MIDTPNKSPPDIEQWSEPIEIRVRKDGVATS
jgi:hypothetical protein